MLWLTGLIALLTLTGMLYHGLVDGRRCALDPERAAGSLNLGAALIGSALVLGLVFFDGYAFPLLFAAPGLLMLACLGLRYLRGAASGRPDGAASRHRRDSVPYRTSMVFPVLAVLFTVFLLALTYKDGASADYLNIWGFKARVLTENDAIRIPSFLDWTHIHHHQDYPVLFPCIQALLYRMAGETLDRTAKLLYPLLLLSASLALYFHLLRRRGMSAALVGGGFCLFTPGICGVHPGICSAYMDIPLGLFLLLAFLAGTEWLDRGRATSGLTAGIFFAAAALTKNEGMAAAALAILLFCIAWLRRVAKKYMMGFVWLALLPATAGGAWLVLRTQLPAGASDYVSLFTEGALIEQLSDAPAALGRYLLELLHFERWGFLWVLFAACAPFWMKRGWAVPGLFIAAMALIHISAITVSPLGVDYQIPSAVSRLVGQLAPLAAACVGLAFGRKEDH